MKQFEYPTIQVTRSDALPNTFDSALEWRELSQQTFVNASLQGGRRLKTLLPTGEYWSFAKAPGVHSTFEYLTLARSLVVGSVRRLDTHVVLLADAEIHLDALLSALLASLYELPTFKKLQMPLVKMQITLVGPISEEIIQQRLAEAEGNALVRFLTALPSNELNPKSYREFVEQLAKIEGWDYRFFSYNDLEQMGAGAFLAVAQGSENKEATIIRLQYNGDKNRNDNIALVGKGVTMDTGGYNLKAGGSMYGMHHDMNGSAVVLGNLLAATRALGARNYTGWLAITDNQLGPQAFHANQCVHALNGTSIEIVDTDAEGRMVLADTLTLATREQPRAVVDFATLTGACIAALSTRYSGAFTNKDEWVLPIIESGKESGERIWPFPLDVDYDENIKSNTADVQQCNSGKSPDHIDAARFLLRFIEPNVPWIHIDLSSAIHKGGLAHVPTDITGVGVRLTQALLQKLP